MFGRLNYWMTMPKVLDQGIAYGDVTAFFVTGD
jgi:hypothetical protein